MDKQYIERNYDMALLDFKHTHNDDERWEARKTMARLENIASSLFGF